MCLNKFLLFEINEQLTRDCGAAYKHLLCQNLELSKTRNRLTGLRPVSPSGKHNTGPSYFTPLFIVGSLQTIAALGLAQIINPERHASSRLHIDAHINVRAIVRAGACHYIVRNMYFMEFTLLIIKCIGNT